MGLIGGWFGLVFSLHHKQCLWGHPPQAVRECAGLPLLTLAKQALGRRAADVCCRVLATQPAVPRRGCPRPQASLGLTGVSVPWCAGCGSLQGHVRGSFSWFSDRFLCLHISNHMNFCCTSHMQGSGWDLALSTLQHLISRDIFQSSCCITLDAIT